MWLPIVITLSVVVLSECQTADALGSSERVFPDHVRFGVATSAYQIEGAWNVSDKSENAWDHFTHTKSHLIAEASTGDVACDSYHLYERDVEMLRELGVHFYRFSISWSRLLPRGYGREVSVDGLRYYNGLIDSLLRHNITPMVTLFHWDTPQNIMEVGGWANPLIVDFFENFATVAFKHFGDRVKHWVTINEPTNVCLIGYGTNKGPVRLAPDANFHGFGEYQCAHNVLKAHAAAYHVYNTTFRPYQNGQVGLATHLLWVEPESNSTVHMEVADKGIQFWCGWFLHPIFSQEGDYPKVMREQINRCSKEQGFQRSRLPYFTEKEINMIRGSADFVGLNYYTSVMFSGDTEAESAMSDVPSQADDLGYTYYQPDDWPQGTAPGFKLWPRGLRSGLNWVKESYGDREVYVTEVGFSSLRSLQDTDRVNFINDHAAAVLDAIQDGVNVTHFTFWSLMDNFEWSNGYTEYFGLYQVNIHSGNKTRTARMSALVYKEIIKSKRIQPLYRPRVVEAVEEDTPKLGGPDVWVIAAVVVGVTVTLVASLFVLRFRKRGLTREIVINNPISVNKY